MVFFSDAVLNCKVHGCPQRCHQLVDHSKMPCERPVKSKCDVGHIISYKCRNGPPASCKTCDRERKETEKRLKDEQERQEKRNRELREHAEKIAKIDEEMRLLQEAAVDKRRSHEMAQALEQKKRDLEDAKRLQERAQKQPINPKAQPTVPIKSPAETTPVIESATPGKDNLDNDASPPEPQIDTAIKTSPSEAEWIRQKETENASNRSIDSLMKMTGLEEMKAQFLTIKAKTEIAIRQDKDMKGERFGIVLLGNPGTGRLLRYKNHWLAY